MIESLKTKHPRIYKHLFTVTTFSKLLALSMFILFPIFGFYLGMKYQEKTNPLSNVNVTTASSNEISNDINIYKKDLERSKPEICGYTESIKKKILEAQGINSTNNNFNYYLQNQGLDKGVWSNDCKKYIYSFNPQGAGWTAGPISPSVGLWLYEPDKATSTKIINDFADPDRWLTYNLVSLDNKLVVDIELKKIISDENVDIAVSPWNPSKYSDWIMYRNADFAWQFMHPKNWKLTKSVKNSSGKIQKLVFNTQVSGLSVTFYSEVPASIKLDRYQANVGNNLYKFGYINYYSQSLDPSRVYINNKNSNYPSAIVFSWIKDQDLVQGQDNELVYIGETIGRYKN